MEKTFVQFPYGKQMCSWDTHYFSAERQTTWQMPGMDSPWKLEVGDSSAPVGAKRMRFHFPDRIPESR